MYKQVNQASRPTQDTQIWLSDIVFYVCIKCSLCVANVRNYSSTCPKLLVFSFLTNCAHRCCFSDLHLFLSNFSILHCLVQRSYLPCILSLSLHFKMTFSVTEILQTYPPVLWYVINIDFYVLLTTSINYIPPIPHSSESLSSFTCIATVGSWLVFLPLRPASSSLVHSPHRN